MDTFCWFLTLMLFSCFELGDLHVETCARLAWAALLKDVDSICCNVSISSWLPRLCSLTVDQAFSFKTLTLLYRMMDVRCNKTPLSICRTSAVLLLVPSQRRAWKMLLD